MAACTWTPAPELCSQCAVGTGTNSELVTDLPQQVPAPGDVGLAFHPLRAEAVHDAQDPTPLFRLGENDLGWIGGGTKDTAHFGHHLHRIEHVYRVVAVPEEQDEGVSGTQRLRVFLREFHQRAVGPGPPNEAFA